LLGTVGVRAGVTRGISLSRKETLVEFAIMLLFLSCDFCFFTSENISLRNMQKNYISKLSRLKQVGSLEFYIRMEMIEDLIPSRSA
jgi:hypothetical protein